jgi:hypothetical protein
MIGEDDASQIAADLSSSFWEKALPDYDVIRKAVESRLLV